MIRDFGGFTRMGLLVDLERPVDIWRGGGGGDITQTGQGGARPRWRRKNTDRPPTCLRCESKRPRVSFIVGDTSDPKSLGFHSVKLSEE